VELQVVVDFGLRSWKCPFPAEVGKGKDLSVKSGPVVVHSDYSDFMSDVHLLKLPP
jgi:hypothetical protein